MEKLDRQILALLAVDGRMSYTDIGHATGLSTSAAQQRVRRLEQRGIISGYRAILNEELLHRDLIAFISIRAINGEEDEATPNLLASFPEIISCYATAGSSSYLVKAQVASTSELNELLTRLRTSARLITETQVVLMTHFRDRPLVAIDADNV